MKKRTLLLSIMAAASCNTIAQESFTSEVSGLYASADGQDTFAVGGAYFFAPVDTSKGPLAEAVFLNRSNNINAAYTRVEFDGPASANVWGLGGTYHIDNSGVFINVSTAQANGSDLASYNLGAGYYISNDWTVTLGTSFDDDLEYEAFDISTKKLLTLGGDAFLNLEAAMSVPDEGDNGYAFGGDYYFNKSVSVGLDYAWVDSFSDGVSTVSVNWFVTPAISLALAYSEADSDDAIAISVNARF